MCVLAHSDAAGGGRAMIDKSSELWDRKNVDSVFEKGLGDTEVGGLEILGINHSSQCNQS